LNHVNTVSKKLCTYPGFALSIDEMMKIFKGRSHMTVRMKCKPIKEGFKFYAICDSSTGFVYHFIPDGLRMLLLWKIILRTPKLWSAVERKVLVHLGQRVLGKNLIPLIVIVIVIVIVIDH